MRIVAVLLGGLLAPQANAVAEPPLVDAAAPALSIPFVANHGQWPAEVAFRAQTRFGALFVTGAGELVYALPGKGSPGRVRESLVGATPGAPAALDPARARVSSFRGRDPARWRSNLPTFRRLAFGEVWPGIGLTLAARASNVEKLFSVGAGADPGTIRLAMRDAEALRIMPDGALQVVTGARPLRFSPPLAFQTIGGTRHRVEVAYRLHGDHEYGFALGDYDSDHELVIDPVLQTTFLGGSGTNSVFGMRFHPVNGEVYVYGSTRSTDYPAVAGGAQNGYAGTAGTGFVARLAPDLTAAGGGILQATYFGSDGGDDQNTTVYEIAFHTGGDVFIAGTTSTAFLPGTAGGRSPTSSAASWTGSSPA